MRKVANDTGTRAKALVPRSNDGHRNGAAADAAPRFAATSVMTA